MTSPSFYRLKLWHIDSMLTRVFLSLICQRCTVLVKNRVESDSHYLDIVKFRFISLFLFPCFCYLYFICLALFYLAVYFFLPYQDPGLDKLLKKLYKFYLGWKTVSISRQRFGMYICTYFKTLIKFFLLRCLIKININRNVLNWPIGWNSKRISFFKHFFHLSKFISIERWKWWKFLLVKTNLRIREKINMMLKMFMFRYDV